MRVSTVIGLGLLTLSVPALAAVGSDKDSKKDPNRVICEKQEELGSRLSAKRVCHTAAEWDAIRQEARQNLDKAQTNRQGVNGR